jgi:hypothetical protein
MQAYKNFSGQSNVSRFEIGGNYIVVEFKTRGKDGRNTYKYSYGSTGQRNVDHMKSLAEAGRGLNSFVNATVRKLYESKW